MNGPTNVFEGQKDQLPLSVYFDRHDMPVGGWGGPLTALGGGEMHFLLPMGEDFGVVLIFQRTGMRSWGHEQHPDFLVNERRQKVTHGGTNPLF